MKNENKIIALSLFSGIGGFEVGMARSGLTIAKTLEWDEKCCKTLNANKLILGTEEDYIEPIDITKMPPEDFYSGKVDYIVGGPPCQSFSAAGRRAGGVAGTNDMRGTLFEYYCKYVNHFKPKAFVFENVRGILSANKGEDFNLIMQSFADLGYKIFWKILNAADYGAPQLRERVFLVGIRDDLNINFMFPLPTHGPDSPTKVKYVTTREAIADVQDENEEVLPYSGKYGYLIPDIPVGENYRFYTEEMGHPNPLFAWRSKFSNFLYKMDPDDVCRTVIAYQGKYDGPFHWKNRKCTVSELQRLQGFPKDFVIDQTYAEGVKQVGNSVCPLVAEQIGKALRFQIEKLSEYKIPLLDEDQKLSFDKRKGDQARKSRAKKVEKYSNLGQLSIFDISEESQIEYVDFKRERTLDELKIEWAFKNGELTISISTDSAQNKALLLSLNFIGSIRTAFKAINLSIISESWKDSYLKIMWDEIHNAVKKLSSYDSLMPLYGHFTEPYPKFTIDFECYFMSEMVKFQRMALDGNIINKVLDYSTVSDNPAAITHWFKQIRDFGFDIRTNNTNRTIPENYFKICYPFTLPKTLKGNIIWKDK